MEDYKKKYEESLERGLRLWESGSITLEEYEYMFPEHKESKDERIRKFLYDFINNIPPEEWNKDKPNEDFRITVLDWLEKQGKQRGTIDIDKMVADYRDNPEKNNEHFGKPVNSMVRAYRQGIIDILSTIKQKDMKSSWSEEDDRIRYAICDTLDRIDEHVMKYNNHLTHQQVKDWLKSLKERMKGE